MKATFFEENLNRVSIPMAVAHRISRESQLTAALLQSLELPWVFGYKQVVPSGTSSGLCQQKIFGLLASWRPTQ